MKLYATTTSERASKGQGGNEYICIKLTVQNGSKQDYPIGEIILDYNDDVKQHGTDQNEWVLKYLSHKKYEADIIDRGNVEPPKIKQKNSTCAYSGVDGDWCEAHQSVRREGTGECDKSKGKQKKDEISQQLKDDREKDAFNAGMQ